MPLIWLIALVGFLYSPYVYRFFDTSRPSISVFVWSDIVDREIIDSFEKETGIKVYLNYYEGNDEMFAKLQFSGGEGYDLIMPTHYMVKTLIKGDFLKKIDKKRLNFWEKLDPHFLNHSFDPQNQYSIPYIWEIYGLGIDGEFFAHKKINNSWQMLFEPAYKYRVGMTDESREVLNVASLYLFGTLEGIGRGKPTRIKNLLIKQKEFVEAYTDLTLDFLLTSKAAPVVLMPASSLYRARQRVDWAKFVFPREGSVFTIENFAIAAKSKKDDMVYAFINYLFKENALKRIFERYGYLPARKDVLHSLDLSFMGNIDYIFDSYFKKVYLVSRLFSREQTSALWLAIKS